jgi:hypothetical protein
MSRMSHALTLLALTLAGADAPACCTKPQTAPCPALTANAKARAPEVWAMTLREAIRIGLDNCEAARVITLMGQPACAGQSACADPPPSEDGVRIAPTRADVNPCRFKAEVMALVRSVEQQYWSLAQQQSQLWASEKAVEMADEVLRRERSELEVGRGTVADVAEAQQRYEQFQLDLLTKTSDVITTERQLRSLLGLPPADDRRILPLTAPTETKVSPDWDACLAAMKAKQPDVLRQEANVREKERQAAEAEAVVDAAMRLLPVLADLGTAKLGRARESLERERAFLKQVVHQTTHSLARFLLEVDANYKQFQTAARFREATSKRLEAQRKFYEEGRISIDRYLDAVSQYASAVAQEAQFRTCYNVSLVALEEAKGTLLEYEKITVLDGPRPVSAPVAATTGTRDDAARPAALEATPEPTKAPAAGCGAEDGCCAGASATPAAGKTVTFRFTIGAGPKPVEVRGEFTIATVAKP